MSQFAQHYARLHDEELIELALRQELVPEASAALQAELARRGIGDLASHQAIRQREAIAEETHRQEQIARRAKVTSWRTKFLYAVSMLVCAYGVFRIFAPNAEQPGDDGGLMLVLGIAIFVLALISSWISRIWSERVLHRPPAP